MTTDLTEFIRQTKKKMHKIRFMITYCYYYKFFEKQFFDEIERTMSVDSGNSQPNKQ